MFSSFRDLADLTTVWNDFGNISTFSETFGTFEKYFKHFWTLGDDLTSRSCSSNHAVKVSLSIIIG